MNIQMIVSQKLAITVLAFSVCICLAKDNSTLNLLSASFNSQYDANSNPFNLWADYHKKTEAKLDHILANCYECIEKRNNNNNGESISF